MNESIRKQRVQRVKMTDITEQKECEKSLNDGNKADILPVWYIYMIKTRLDTLYTGITTDVARRFKEHSRGSKKAARYLRGKGPLELMWHQEVGTKSDALKAEYKMKQLSKGEKLQIINKHSTIKASS
ncbi:GIY-YIG nuclease family protein [Marinomonas algarum]|uniref:GIY-YIG nuclease family protein n=1 Tax=Marinomonas algarum TaxID=2883105 RepID=A0A9X1LF67_9GAMM|nr:GIY-YIG nuclease family protein [Marinomonas algarum]MCB5162445.1 GIY-YIG nuclease family protein [Marinomonas algarum]